MYPYPIITKHGQECRISEDCSTSLYKSAASCHNWGAVPPNLPPLDWQFTDTNGIAGSRDHACSRAHSVINNWTGPSSPFLAREGGYHMRCWRNGEGGVAICFNRSWWSC